VNIATRTVPLAAGSDERLVFDYAQGLYRVAYYLPPPPGRLISTRRITHKAKSLYDCLLVVFGEADCDQDPDTVEHYMRSQPWGRDLP